MKKKVKDLTIGEIIDVCSKNNNCRDCPLFVIDAAECLPCREIYEEVKKTYLNKEVEL